VTSRGGRIRRKPPELESLNDEEIKALGYIAFAHANLHAFAVFALGSLAELKIGLIAPSPTGRPRPDYSPSSMRLRSFVSMTSRRPFPGSAIGSCAPRPPTRNGTGRCIPRG
jgi:hypothetical protein